jgi:hypothetical protein
MRAPDGLDPESRVGRLVSQSRRWPSTQLGVGVVSTTTVDAAIDLAQRHDISLMLIASRRQVEADDLGGGYVDGLNAHRLVEHVRRREPEGRVLVCRDHGGPWQGAEGADVPAGAAMENARRSLADDIEAGFDVLHIDTSADPTGGGDSVVRDRLLELYEWCWSLATRLGRTIAFEVGDEEQVEVVVGLDRPRLLLAALSEQCSETGAPMPLFTVAQTGTKVMERRNVGSFGAPYRVDGQMPPNIYIPQVQRLLAEHGTNLKQHNTDYLSTEVLEWHPLSGIDAANVAPEYGVEETLCLLGVMEGTGATDLRERFLELAHGTGKWRKWELPGTSATDRERAILAGHYVFGTPEFAAIRADLLTRASVTGDRLDDLLRARVRESIARYLRAFRLVP